MDLKEYNKTINQLSDVLIRKYFNGDRKKSRISISQLMVKFGKNNYETFTISQPISTAYFRNNFQYLCQKEPDLVRSIVYLNSDESTYLVNDLNTVIHSDKIMWNEIPSIKTLAAAEQIFQKAKQKTKQLLHQEKPLKKDTTDIIKLVEPLSGAKHFTDIQKVYWMLYCELRFTLQLLKPDKDFDISFGFDKEGLNLRSRDLPLLSLLGKTDLKTYGSNSFRKDTLAYLNDYYNNVVLTKNDKSQNIISDSVIKIKMDPFPKKTANNEISINNNCYKKVQNSPFELLYYLLWLRKNFPEESSGLEISGTIPDKHIVIISKNDDKFTRFSADWNSKTNPNNRSYKSKEVVNVNKLLRSRLKINFDSIVLDGEYYKLTNKFKPDNIELVPFDAHI